MGFAEVEKTVEHPDGLSRCALREGNQPNTPMRPHDRIGLPGRVGSPSRVDGMDLRLFERADLGQPCRQVASGKSCRKHRKPKKAIKRFLFQRPDDALKHLYGRSALTSEQPSACQVHTGCELKAVIAQLARDD